MTDQFTNNTAKSRYELLVGDQIAFANYRQEKNTLFIDYVEAPESLRGTGAAGRLMQHVYDQAQQNNWEIIPICGYAASWLRRHAR